MTYKGYGSSNPIFSDQQINNMKTTLEKKEAHQKNRRTVWRETL
jgi:outer membrane protein OmpA-like peptidoglycan-associated protein